MRARLAVRSAMGSPHDVSVVCERAWCRRHGHSQAGLEAAIRGEMVLVLSVVVCLPSRFRAAVSDLDLSNIPVIARFCPFSLSLNFNLAPFLSRHPKRTASVTQELHL